VHLVPDPTVPTSETGTRHRTAERVARSLGVPVLSVSEDMAVIQLYVRSSRHQLHEVSRLLDRANQALQTLERYQARLTDALATLTALEIEDLVTLRDVASVMQRAEMVHRLTAEIEMMIAELGVDARLLRLQLDELLSEIADELDLTIKDYLPALGGRSVDDVLRELTRLSEEDTLDLRHAAASLRLPGGADLDQSVTPRGERMLARVPRLPTSIAEKVADHFGDLNKILRATVSELAEVEGVGTTRARAIKESLARVTETTILDQYA
jgi:diadenylate cyclase